MSTILILIVGIVCLVVQNEVFTLACLAIACLLLMLKVFEWASEADKSDIVGGCELMDINTWGEPEKRKRGR